MKLLSLFSGGGLGDFGFMAAGIDIAYQCELDEFCQKILNLRYPDSQKFRDIRELKGEQIEKIDIIAGGFPCQPFSLAGKKQGKSDNRYLWPEMFRVIKECKPRWVVGENVPGVINLALDTVCLDLESQGYEVWPIVFPANALQTPHQRDRVWIVAHAINDGDRGREGSNSQADSIPQFDWPALCPWDLGGTSKVVALFGQKQYGWEAQRSIKSGVGGAVDDAAVRVHRLKMLGNGQVPACTYVIGKMIMEIERGSL